MTGFEIFAENGIGHCKRRRFYKMGMGIQQKGLIKKGTQIEI